MNANAILGLISDLYDSLTALNVENSQLRSEVSSLRDALTEAQSRASGIGGSPGGEITGQQETGTS